MISSQAPALVIDYCLALEHPLLSRESSLQHAALYVAQLDPSSPLISPIYADLRGLPPLFIQVGDCEVLLSDSVRLAERARQAAST
jgi:epsilon-lactone hydrolase